MDAICNTLKILFPAKGPQMARLAAVALIDERDPGASFTQFEWTGARFLTLQPTIAKDMSAFFQSYGASPLFYKDCDGITLFEDKERRYMFLTELKSSFDNRIAEAKHQLLSSLLKINLLLTLTPGWEIEKTVIKGFIVSPRPGEAKASEWKRDYRRHVNSARRHEFRKEAFFGQLLTLADRRLPLTLTPEASHHLGPCHLGARAVPPRFDLYYIPVPDGAKSYTLPVAPYL